MKAKILTILVLALISFTAFAQEKGGIVDILIQDRETGETLPFVNCLLMSNGVQKSGTSTDFDGKAQLRNIEPGEYDLKISYVGYAPLTKRITVYSEGADVKIELKSASNGMEEIVVVEYEVPLIDKDAGASGATVTRDDIAKMPVRSASCCGTNYIYNPRQTRKAKRQARRADRKEARALKGN